MRRDIRRLVAAIALAGVGVGALPPMTSYAVGTVTLIAVTPTSTWSKPSPDPSGLAVHPRSGRLFLVDSEVDETSLFRRSNAWSVNPGGTVNRSWSLMRFTNEPTDIAFRNAKTLFVTDDNQDRVFRIRRGPDGRWGTRDDRATSFPTRPFGSRDPEGLGTAPRTLFVADGEDARVYRVRPGRNGRLDGIPPLGDDVVTSFSTATFGIRDPEDVVYDPTTQLLYIISSKDDVLVRATRTGMLVDTFDLSSLDIVAAAGIALAPRSSDPTAWSVFVVDRGTDNDVDPSENDGRLFELALE